MCVCVILNFISAAEMSDIIASIAPISGSPFLGFDHIPHSPVSVIDFHGTDDDTIPYDLNRYTNFKSKLSLKLHISNVGSKHINLPIFPVSMQLELGRTIH